MTERTESLAIVSFFLVVLVGAPATADDAADRWDGFDDVVAAAMEQWQVPGVAMAVISDDEVVYSLATGYRDVASQLPVTLDTVFAIGSSSKSFTATLVGILVGEGAIDWDTQVTEYLPGFALEDPLAGARMTPRDLLCHRSGLPDHTLAWYARPSTREEIVHRLRHLEFTADFRNAFQYNNFMITTAGYLAAQMSDSTWEEMLQERIFDPLGMTSSGVIAAIGDPRSHPNFALPYSARSGNVEEIPLSDAYDAVGPAGTITSSITDLVSWVKLQLDGGTFGDQQIIPETVLKEMHSPQMTGAGISMLKEATVHGLGWFIEPTEWGMRLNHAGGFEGYVAYVSFMPSQDAGVVVLTNLHANSLPYIVQHAAYDRLLGDVTTDWVAKAIERSTEAAKAAAQEFQKTMVVRHEGTSPAHLQEDYAGEYAHPGYGTLHVTSSGDGLKASVNGVVALDLDHFHYEVFSVAKIDAPGREYAHPYYGLAKFIFRTNLRGDVDLVIMTHDLDPGTGQELGVVFERR